MSGRDPTKREAREALEQALLEGEGSCRLEPWLAYLLDRPDLEELVRRFSLKIKGFRVERAPHRILLASLAKAFLQRGEVRRAVLGRIWARPTPQEGPSPQEPSPAVESREEREEEGLEEEVRGLKALVEEARREQSALELQARELQGELRKAKAAEEDFRRRALDAEADKRRLEEQVRKLKDLAPEAKAARDLKRRILALEEENERLRASLASLTSERTSLEKEVESWKSRARGKKGARQVRKEPPPSLPADDQDQWRIPVFEREFREALLAQPAQEAQKILRTVFFACQDPSYPSLNLKKLEGKGDLWSVRVDPGLRLIFLREGKIFRFVAFTDREDQDTELKSLRERYG